MTAQTLPDEPNFCFVPAYDVETDVQQIRIVIEGLAGHVPTALIALDLDDALTICDKLNRRLGYDRDAWTAMAAASMRAETPEPGDPRRALRRSLVPRHKLCPRRQPHRRHRARSRLERKPRPRG